ncbi:MAG: hypothetical protein Q4B22_07665 [Eubacteriales bacterium]|nr:hypothetical protein [Eubacteriales bacterium]
MRSKYLSVFMCILCMLLWLVTGIRQMNSGASGAFTSFMLAGGFAVAAVVVWSLYNKKR